MGELFAQVMAILRGMWRRRWIGLLAAWAVAVVGAAAVWRTPDRFEATARVYVDTKGVLKPLMRDLTVEPDLDQTLQLLAKTLITRPNIELLLRKGKLDTPGMTQVERDVMVDRLMREIKLSSAARDNVFAFSYRDVSPQKARVLVEQLVTLFVESDLGAKARDTDAARGFIDQQIKIYEGRLAEAETRLKDFKLRNLGMSDPTGKDYFARISILTEELSKLMVDLRAAEQSREARKRELSGETAPLIPDVPPPVYTLTTEYDARLDAQRKQLDELLRRYTDLHPDVISTRRLITRLEEQRQQELDARRRAEASAPARATSGSNAVQQQTKLALAEAEAAVAALNVRVSDTQSRLGQLRASASRVPQIEAEFAQLNRDYDVVRRNYEVLVSQREKALMSEEVESTRLAHFRVIDPPRTSDKPVFPNRGTLAILVLMAALGAGLAASFLMYELVPTVDSSVALRQLSRRPVLGSVSMLATPEMVRRGRRHLAAFASGVGALVLAFAVLSVLLSAPLRV
jgi:polysaccharide chain length determinant protein (PEP-CTERM system associated)